MFKRFLRKSRSSDIDQLLGQYDLPSFPSAVLTVLSKLRDPEVPLQAITEDLEIDPGLHVRVLRTVNSVAFGLSNKVSDIGHATSLLGRSRLEALVLSVVTKETLDRGLVPGWFDMKSFWMCSTRRAALARKLSQKLHSSNQAEAFTAGLLQDMAVPVIAAIKGEEYRDIYQTWQNQDNVDLALLEREHFGVCHPDLGAALAERWGFPEGLVHNVSGHHAEAHSDVEPAVQIAALIKDQKGEADHHNLITQACHTFKLDHSWLSGAVSEAEQDALELYEILS